MSLENLERILAAFDIPRLSCLPVEDLPDVVDVRSLAVEVLEIIRMLPHIHADDGGIPYNDSFLVSERRDA